MFSRFFISINHVVSNTFKIAALNAMYVFTSDPILTSPEPSDFKQCTSGLIKRSPFPNKPAFLWPYDIWLRVTL